ncbi:MAG: DUF3048 domain-containing protein [Ilumatobacteraceae bacterium]
MTSGVRGVGKLAAASAMAMAMVACASGTQSASTTTTTSVAPVTIAATSTSPTTAAGVSGTGVASTDGAPTTAPSVPVMPLTGLPITDPAVAGRQAIVVKIDNHPDARPQSGLGVADLVYEENVEELTRFAAVFQTVVPDPVGPVRSGRTQDVLLLGSLDKPMFAWSGGNAAVTTAIDASDFFVVRVDAQTFAKDAGTYRAKDRRSPHNLYAMGSGLLTVSPPASTPPPQQFQYLAPGATSPGAVSSGVSVAMDGVAVKWMYDQTSNAYLRFEDARPHLDREAGPINATNVIILTVDYQPSPADGRSPEAQTIGSGAVAVYTGGRVVTGTWTRPDRLQTFTLADDAGNPILLTPGRTWVELAEAAAASPLET